MHFRLSNGLSLAYHVRGAGRILLFLHPIGTRAAFWDAVVDRIAGHYRCITVDLRGHGESDVPATRFSLDDLADDVIELLRWSARAAPSSSAARSAAWSRKASRWPRPSCSLASSSPIPAIANRPRKRKAVQQRAEDALKGMPAMIDSTLARWFPAPFLALNPPEVQACRAWLLEDDPVVFSWGWEAIRDLDYGERIRPSLVPVACCARLARRIEPARQHASDGEAPAACPLCRDRRRRPCRALGTARSLCCAAAGISGTTSFRLEKLPAQETAARGRTESGGLCFAVELPVGTAHVT